MFILLHHDGIRIEDILTLHRLYYQKIDIQNAGHGGTARLMMRKPEKFISFVAEMETETEGVEIKITFRLASEKHELAVIKIAINDGKW